MTTSTGEVAIERLDAARRSLERATQALDVEIQRRDPGQSYNHNYLRQCAEISQEASTLEDRIRQGLRHV